MVISCFGNPLALWRDFGLRNINNLRIFFTLSMIFWDENNRREAGVEGMEERAMIGGKIDTGGGGMLFEQNHLPTLHVLTRL